MNLDQRLDGLSELAASVPKPEVFFNALVEALNASSGVGIAAAVWSVENGGFRLQAEIGMQSLGLVSDVAIRSIHEEAIAQACQSDTGSISVRSQGENCDFLFNTSRFEGSSFLILELVCPVSAGQSKPDSQCFSLLQAFNESARDYRNQLVIKELRQRDDVWNRLSQSLPRWYGNHDLRQVCYYIANDLAAMSRIDRVTVGVYQSSNSEIQAISGLMTFERRSKQVLRLEALFSVAAKAGLKIQSPISHELPPVCAQALDEYIDESGNESLLIIPSNVNEVGDLKSKESSVTIIAFENFRDGGTIDISTLRDPLVHAQLALLEAVERRRGIGIKVGRSVDQALTKITRNKWGAFLACSSIAALLTGIFAIPVSNELAVEGYMEYASSRDVFAPLDAEIVSLDITHGKAVQQGEQLVSLRSRTLELKREEIVTQRDVAIEKHRSIEASRLLDRRNRNQDAAASPDYAAAEKELRELIDGQELQLRIVDDIMQSLKLTSPAKGQVVSWNNSNDWLTRPVRQGQRLASIVDLQSPEILQLKLNDVDAHMLYERLGTQGETRIQFTLVSNPVEKFEAVIDSASLNANRSDAGSGFIQLKATVISGQNIPPSPGASVRGRIACGKVTLGYHWGRKIINQWRLWWYF